MVSLLCGFCFVLEIAHRRKAWWMEACAGLDRGPGLSLSYTLLKTKLNVECFKSSIGLATPS